MQMVAPPKGIILQLTFVVVVVVNVYRGPGRGVRAWVLVQVTQDFWVSSLCVLAQSAFGVATRLAVLPHLRLMLK